MCLTLDSPSCCYFLCISKRAESQKVAKSQFQVKVLFYPKDRSKKKEGNPFLFVLFDVFHFSLSCKNKVCPTERAHVSTPLLQHCIKTHFESARSSCHPPCLAQSGNAALSSPIKLQSTNEDGVRHRITSNILSHTQACLRQPQISLQIKAQKTEEAELPDNNRITSCQRLDVSWKLGIQLPAAS